MDTLTNEWWAHGKQYLLPVLQVLAIALVAILLHALVRRVLRRIGARYQLPSPLVTGTTRLTTFVISTAAALLVLDRLGVSASVLWTAFTGFAAVGAVAFFAAWSVLSNIFCALLIFITRPFRLLDEVELVENGEKPGFRGRVIAINLIYTTLQEHAGAGNEALLQVPNSLFFQRITRRWHSRTAIGAHREGSASTGAHDT